MKRPVTRQQLRTVLVQLAELESGKKRWKKWTLFRGRFGWSSMWWPSAADDEQVLGRLRRPFLGVRWR